MCCRWCGCLLPFRFGSLVRRMDWYDCCGDIVCEILVVVVGGAVVVREIIVVVVGVVAGVCRSVDVAVVFVWFLLILVIIVVFDIFVFCVCFDLVIVLIAMSHGDVLGPCWCWFRDGPRLRLRYVRGW